MKTLSPRIHGYIDYAVVLMFALAPSLFDFSREAATVSYALAVVHLTLTVVTAFPLGLVKALPFTVHGAIELVMAPLLIALPWIAGFASDDSARNYFIVSGAALFMVWLLTDYKTADAMYGKKGIDLGNTPRGMHA